MRIYCRLCLARIASAIHVRSWESRRPKARTRNPLPRDPKKQDTMPQLDAITKAITEGFAKVAKALDDNTRAIRCQEKTPAKAVDELKRIERRLTQMDSTLAEKAED